MSGKSKRGFASMSPEKQREIASKGGKAAHAKGTAHEFTPEEARAAGRKGGQSSHTGGQTGTAVAERPRQSEGGENFAPEPVGNGQRGFQGGPEQNPTRQPADETRPFLAAGPETFVCPPSGGADASRADREANASP